MPSAKKLLVTGANGFVAGSVVAQAEEPWEVHALSRGGSPGQGGHFRWHVCESFAPAPLARLFHEIKPDVVLHTAALADIDFCQANPAAARAVNVELTRTLADLCSASRVKLVFCSTDTVFDGERAPYRETDAPGPLNLYAETKVAAEQIVSTLGDRAVIVRLSLVVGLPVRGAGNSFLSRMVVAFKEGRPVGVPAHEIRTPVDVITAGRALLELAAGEQHGIFHLAGSESLNRFEMARRIARRFGFSDQLVLAQPPAAGRAPRPRDVSLANAKACATLRTPMRDFDDALSLVLKRAGHPAT